MVSSPRAHSVPLGALLLPLRPQGTTEPCPSKKTPSLSRVHSLLPSAQPPALRLHCRQGGAVVQAVAALVWHAASSPRAKAIPSLLFPMVGDTLAGIES